MVNQNDFKKIKAEIDKNEEEREFIIKKSREIVILSKQIIYSVHRKNMKEAEKSAADIKKAIKELKPFENSKHSGSYKVAIQEYVEAVCYLEFVKKGDIPSHTDLDVDVEHYLLGICDLTGELVRKAVNSAIDEKYDDARKIHKFVSDLYFELMKFDFHNGEVRKKFDSIKWDLKKLDEIVFELKMKEKL